MKRPRSGHPTVAGTTSGARSITPTDVDPPSPAPQSTRGSTATTLFFREFIRAPLTTASALPSSTKLAQRMIEPLRGSATGSRAPVVVELGPGTGSFTAAIRDVVPPGARHLAVEINPTFALHLRRHCPWVEVIQASAADLPAVLADHRVAAPDLIVSGLPWQCYRGSGGPALTQSIASALRPGGVFTQFTYSWTRWTRPARRQRVLLTTAFVDVEVSGTVWRNAPPAFVYTCRTGYQRPPQPV